VGGTGLLIHGSVSSERLAPRPVPRTLLDRLLGRTRHTQPKVVGTGRNQLTQVDAAELTPLVARYRAYLARRLPEPHDGTREVLQYLEIDGIPSLYVRGAREPGSEIRWYVQLGFSGCAGMAEVSAAVACHWAAAWIREELPSVQREILAPFGFEPDPAQGFEDLNRFLPVAALGYLRYVLPAERAAGDELFEVDHAVVEGEDDAEARIAERSGSYERVMADGRCRCQLCDPGFVPLSR
jgi:hypothetical protein